MQLAADSPRGCRHTLAILSTEMSIQAARDWNVTLCRGRAENERYANSRIALIFPIALFLGSRLIQQTALDDD